MDGGAKNIGLGSSVVVMWYVVFIGIVGLLTFGDLANLRDDVLS